MACRKIDYRIECYKCGYPYAEAQYIDAEPPLPCDTSDKKLEKHIKPVDLG